MYCQQCGTENSEGTKFCQNCGAPLNNDPSVNAQPIPQQAPVPAQEKKPKKKKKKGLIILI